MSDYQSGPFGEQPAGAGDFPDPARPQSPYPPPAPSQFPPPAPAQFPPPAPNQNWPSGPAGHEPPPSRYEPGPNPYQAGYPAQPPPRAKSGSSKKWLWLLLIVPLLFAMLIGGCVVLLLSATTPAVDATNAYVALLDDGEFEAAYESMCSSSRASTEIDQWVDAIRSELGDVGITDYNFSSVSVTSGRATVSGVIEVDGFPRSAVFTLVSESDEWRVCASSPLG